MSVRTRPSALAHSQGTALDTAAIGATAIDGTAIDGTAPEAELQSGVQERPQLLAGPLIALEAADTFDAAWLNDYFAGQGAIVRRSPGEANDQFAQRVERILSKASQEPWLTPRRLVFGVGGEAQSLPLVLRRRLCRLALWCGVRELVFLLPTTSSTVTVRRTFETVEQVMALIQRLGRDAATCRVVFVPAGGD